MPVPLKNVLDEAGKNTDFVKYQLLSTLLFHSLGDEIGSRHKALLHMMYGGCDKEMHRCSWLLELSVGLAAFFMEHSFYWKELVKTNYECSYLGISQTLSQK